MGTPPLPRPSIDALVDALLQCRKTKNSQHCLQLLAYICEHQLEQDNVLGNYLVPALVDCGSLRDAQFTFETLTHPNEHCWSSLITAYADCREIQHAFHLYHKMQNVTPSKYTFSTLVRACAKEKDAERGRTIHDKIIQYGLEEELFTANTVIDMYGKCASLVDAQQVFITLQCRDVVSWNALIAGYTEFGFAEEAHRCFNQMQVECVAPSIATFLCTLKACGSIEAVGTCHDLHAQLVKRGWEQERYVGSTLVDVYAKCKLLTEAQEVFHGLPVQDSPSWAALISGFAECGLDKEVHKCFKLMQLKKVTIDAITLVRCLKACGMAGALETGREVHASIRKSGFEVDLLIGNTLLDMYGKCSSPAEAQVVFDGLLVRDAVSWNVLIAGYAEIGLCEEALTCFEQMQLEGLTPAEVTYICCLKACSSVAAIERGQILYTEILKRGLEGDLCVGCAVVDLYAKCGLLVEAQNVFNKLPDRNTISWTALIAGYAEHGFAEKALDCFKRMLFQSVQPVAVTFSHCLKACGILGDLEAGLQLHSQVTKTGLESDLAVANTLVLMYSQCGLFLEGRYVFQILSRKNVDTSTTMIYGTSDNHPDKSMQLKSCMFVALLNDCARLRIVKRGQELYSEITERGLESDPVIGNAMVDMYCKGGWLLDAHHVFDKLPVQDVVSWNALIGGYAEQGLGNETLDCFDQMLLAEVPPAAVTFSCTLKACSMLEAVETGQKLHNETVKRGIESGIFIANTLIDMYSKCNQHAEAREVFDKLPIRDSVTWHALIAGCQEHGLGVEALNCFEQMQLEGVSPSETMFACGLKACSSIGALETGRELHTEMSKRGMEKGLNLANTLMDMYGWCGMVGEARYVFEVLPARDVVSWTTMIKGYGENHDGNMAVNCFKNMQGQGVKPDAITFTCLLAACSHSSLVQEGQVYFEVMKDHNEVTMDHYACMVDLLARSGNVHEAERFAEAMQCFSSMEALKALLAACKIYGEVEAGLRYFHQLVLLNQDDGASFLLMADVYASAGRWDDMNKVEEMRKRVGAKRKLARAAIELNKSLHIFIVGENISKDTSTMLQALSSQMKERGYMPAVNLIVANTLYEEKEG